MRRSASAPLPPLAAALERLLAGVEPVRPRRASLEAALGAVAAADVPAPADLPDRATALRDGWAVACEAVAGASPGSPAPLPAAPAWVEAGAALPAGADSVLPPDAVEEGGREATAEAAPGEGVAEAGTQLRAGDVILKAGERIAARHLLALAYAGVREVSARAPRVALLPTGDGSAALAPALAALAREAGCEAERREPAPADLDGLAAALAAAAEGADAVLALGGTGFGRADRSAAALARAGALAVHGIALRPGETAGFGVAAGRPVLLVPGRPDAALAAFVALGRPLLRRLAGLAVEAPVSPQPLLRKIASGLGATELAFVRRAAEGLEPLGGAGLPLRRLLAAEGVVLSPPGEEGYPAGATVEMTPLWTSP